VERDVRGSFLRKTNEQNPRGLLAMRVVRRAYDPDFAVRAFWSSQILVPASSRVSPQAVSFQFDTNAVVPTTFRHWAYRG